MDIFKRSGASHVILTTRHHDGCCLWQTSTTDYSVASSPWKDNKGDVVRELGEACREVNLGLGPYLSPSDRHQSSWIVDHPPYDALYQLQLIELLTNYGDLVEIWFDGAGSSEHPYDWDAIMSTVRKHQPEAMVVNMGSSTVRLVGNEDGLAADSCCYAAADSAASRVEDVHKGRPVGRWCLPPECVVPIRGTWFWQDDDLHTLKSLTNLQVFWYRSIGLGATLLLKVPPNRRGLVDDRDRARMVELGQSMRERFARPVPGMIAQDGTEITVRFPAGTTFDHLVLREAIAGGRFIGHLVIEDGNGTVIIDGVRTVGSHRIHTFPEVTTNRLVITIDHPAARLVLVEAFSTGVASAPSLEELPPGMRRTRCIRRGWSGTMSATTIRTNAATHEGDRTAPGPGPALFTSRA